MRTALLGFIIGASFAALIAGIADTCEHYVDAEWFPDTAMPTQPTKRDF